MRSRVIVGILCAIVTFADRGGTQYKPIDVHKPTPQETTHPEYAVILAFDVKVNSEAQTQAAHDILYHLQDKFKKYMDKIQESKKQEAMPKDVEVHEEEATAATEPLQEEAMPKDVEVHEEEATAATEPLQEEAVPKDVKFHAEEAIAKANLTSEIS